MNIIHKDISLHAKGWSWMGMPFTNKLFLELRRQAMEDKPHIILSIIELLDGENYPSIQPPHEKK